jgi:hypothetical protein
MVTYSYLLDSFFNINEMTKKSVFCIDEFYKNTGKTEANLVLVHAVKEYRGSEVMAVPTLNVDTRWWYVVSLMPQLLYPVE